MWNIYFVDQADAAGGPNQSHPYAGPGAWHRPGWPNLYMVWQPGYPGGVLQQLRAPVRMPFTPKAPPPRHLQVWQPVAPPHWQPVAPLSPSSQPVAPPTLARPKAPPANAVLGSRVTRNRRSFGGPTALPTEPTSLPDLGDPDGFPVPTIAPSSVPVPVTVAPSSLPVVPDDSDIEVVSDSEEIGTPAEEETRQPVAPSYRGPPAAARLGPVAPAGASGSQWRPQDRESAPPSLESFAAMPPSEFLRHQQLQ